MNCEQAKGLPYDALYDTLVEAERGEFQEHCRQCTGCQAALARAGRRRSLLRQWTVPGPPSSVADSVRQALGTLALSQAAGEPEAAKGEPEARGDVSASSAEGRAGGQPPGLSASAEFPPRLAEAPRSSALLWVMGAAAVGAFLLVGVTLSRSDTAGRIDPRQLPRALARAAAEDQLKKAEQRIRELEKTVATLERQIPRNTARPEAQDAARTGGLREPSIASAPTLDESEESGLPEETWQTGAWEAPEPVASSWLPQPYERNLRRLAVRNAGHAFARALGLTGEQQERLEAILLDLLGRVGSAQQLWAVLDAQLLTFLSPEQYSRYQEARVGLNPFVDGLFEPEEFLFSGRKINEVLERLDLSPMERRKLEQDFLSQSVSQSFSLDSYARGETISMDALLAQQAELLRWKGQKIRESLSESKQKEFDSYWQKLFPKATTPGAE